MIGRGPSTGATRCFLGRISTELDGKWTSHTQTRTVVGDAGTVSYREKEAVARKEAGTPCDTVSGERHDERGYRASWVKQAGRNLGVARSNSPTAL